MKTSTRRRGAGAEDSAPERGRSARRSVDGRSTWVATAPTRIDLAGGTLDIWPLSVLIPGAVTVNLAIDLAASVTIRPRTDGKLKIISKDRKARVTKRLPLRDRDVAGPLSLLLRLARAYDLGEGADVEAEAQAPAGAGLGGSSTLAVAAMSAYGAFAGVRLSKPKLLTRVMNLEAAEIRVPTGSQDYLAALHGGLAAYHHEADGPRREGLQLPGEFVDRLVLGYTGRPRQSGYSNWQMFRRFVEGRPDAVRRLEAIAGIAHAFVEAARDGDVERCGVLLAEEGELRAALAPSVTTAEIRAAAKAARRAGAIGLKVCGAGGGGCVVAVAERGRRDDVAEALVGSGVELLDFAPSRTGVRVRRRD